MGSKTFFLKILALFFVSIIQPNVLIANNENIEAEYTTVDYIYVVESGKKAWGMAEIFRTQNERVKLPNNHLLYVNNFVANEQIDLVDLKKSSGLYALSPQPLVVFTRNPKTEICSTDQEHPTLNFINQIIRETKKEKKVYGQVRTAVAPSPEQGLLNIFFSTPMTMHYKKDKYKVRADGNDVDVYTYQGDEYTQEFPNGLILNGEVEGLAIEDSATKQLLYRVSLSTALIQQGRKDFVYYRFRVSLNTTNNNVKYLDDSNIYNAVNDFFIKANHIKLPPLTLQQRPKWVTGIKIADELRHMSAIVVAEQKTNGAFMQSLNSVDQSINNLFSQEDKDFMVDLVLNLGAYARKDINRLAQKVQQSGASGFSKRVLALGFASLQTGIAVYRGGTELAGYLRKGPKRIALDILSYTVGEKDFLEEIKNSDFIQGLNDAGNIINASRTQEVAEQKRAQQEIMDEIWEYYPIKGKPVTVYRKADGSIDYELDRFYPSVRPEELYEIQAGYEPSQFEHDSTGMQSGAQIDNSKPLTYAGAIDDELTQLTLNTSTELVKEDIRRHMEGWGSWQELSETWHANVKPGEMPTGYHTPSIDSLVKQNLLLHYHGNTVVEAYNVKSAQSFVRSGGPINLAIDFGKRAFTGSTSLQGATTPNGTRWYPFRLDLSGSLVGNGLSGSIDMMHNLDTGNSFAPASSSLNGVFFGPNAEGVGGVFQSTFPTSGDRYDGSFGAKR